MARILIGRKLHKDTDSVTVAQGPANGSAWPVANQTQIVPVEYDYVEVTAKDAAGNPTTVEFRIGGAGGVLVSTLTIAYDADGDLQSVTRT